jgi:small GTP-binding protein
VGDGAIGKTCLLSRLTNNVIDWSEEVPYEPTTFNNFKMAWENDPDETHPEPQTLDLELWDTAGQEGFEQLRTLSYPGTDIYLIGYSTDSLISLNNIEHKWLEEIKHGLVESCVDEEPWTIMVGTKMDLRTDEVTVEKAKEVAKSINACTLVDTSARMDDLTKSGVTLLQSRIMQLGFMKAEGKARPNWDTEGLQHEYTNGEANANQTPSVAAPTKPPAPTNVAEDGDKKLPSSTKATPPPSKPPPSKPAATTDTKPAPTTTTTPPPDEGCKCIIA